MRDQESGDIGGDPTDFRRTQEETKKGKKGKKKD
jgi:hypothetical protein